MGDAFIRLKQSLEEILLSRFKRSLINQVKTTAKSCNKLIEKIIRMLYMDPSEYFLAVYQFLEPSETSRQKEKSLVVIPML